jgi:hypothetical protein
LHVITIEILLFSIKNTIFIEADGEHGCVTVADGDELALEQRSGMASAARNLKKIGTPLKHPNWVKLGPSITGGKP